MSHPAAGKGTNGCAQWHRGIHKAQLSRTDLPHTGHGRIQHPHRTGHGQQRADQRHHANHPVAKQETKATGQRT
ncbi:hypothetical protein D3C75_812590 [compost metagenome]